RGTWGLAAAVWVAGCGALWWTVPERPRTAWQSPRSCQLIGFLGAGHILTTLDSPSYGLPCFVRLWDARDGMSLAVLPDRNGESAVAASLTPDGGVVFAARGDTRPEYQVRLYRPGTSDARVLLTSNCPTLAGTLNLSPDGRALAAFDANASTTGVADLWDCDRQELVTSFKSMVAPVFSPDGRWLAATDLGQAGYEFVLW